MNRLSLERSGSIVGSTRSEGPPIESSRQEEGARVVPDGPAAAQPDDSPFVAAVLAREARAVEEFAERMRLVPRVLSVLNRRHGCALDEHELADLGQDVQILVWRKLDEFRGPAVLEAWVYGITCLEYLNARRARARLAQRAVPLADGREPEAPRVDAEPAERATEVAAALATLDPSQAAVLRLRLFEEISFKAIGERLGVPENTAKTRFHRGLLALKERLRTRESGGRPR